MNKKVKIKKIFKKIIAVLLMIIFLLSNISSFFVAGNSSEITTL
jgi:hypothetical protein